MSSAKVIAIPDGPYSAVDCLCVFLLRHTSEFADSRVVRTSDPSDCDAACNTGGCYDHDRRRYDHSQADLSVHFPNSARKLCSSGLVFLHFGAEAIARILSARGRDVGEWCEYLRKSMYDSFVREIDCVAHGLPQYAGETAYAIHTGLCERVLMMNAWEGRFEAAVDMVGGEFCAKLLTVVDSDVPAIEVVRDGFGRRLDVEPGGRIVLFDAACPSEKHLKKLEKEAACDPILFVVQPRTDGAWAIRAMTSGVGRFALRKKLPFAGLRDNELSQKAGIPGGIFVHKAGFLAGFRTREGAIEFAKVAVCAAEPDAE